MSPKSIFSLGFVRGRCGRSKKLKTASKEVNAYEQESCTYYIRNDGDEQKDKDRGRGGNNHQVTLREQEWQYGISLKKEKNQIRPGAPPIGAKWQQISGPAVQLCRTFFIVKIFFETEYIY